MAFLCDVKKSKDQSIEFYYFLKFTTQNKWVKNNK